MSKRKGGKPVLHRGAAPAVQPPVPTAPVSSLFLSRDQTRALHAYKSVREVAQEQGGVRSKYRTIIMDLGVTLRRHGLSACFALLERRSGNADDAAAIQLLLKHLADAKISVLSGTPPNDIAERVRGLELDDYIMVTRELLAITVWLKRAVQALLGQETDDA